MPTLTTNYGLEMPLVNNATDSDIWGDLLNDDLTDLDALLKTAIQWIPSVQTTSFAITAPTPGTAVTGSSKIIYLCNATAGNIVVTLPSAASCSGMDVGFKKTDATVNLVTVTRDGTDTIDGAMTAVLNSQWDRLEIVSDGVSAWRIVSTPSANVFTGDSGSGGTTGLVPAPAAGDAAANKFLKASGAWVAPALTTSYNSGLQTYSLAAQLILAHGMGKSPAIVSFLLHCITGEFGYTAGDEVFMNLGANENGNNGTSIVPDATNLTIRFGASAVQISSKNGGNITPVTVANWSARFIAYA